MNEATDNMSCAGSAFAASRATAVDLSEAPRLNELRNRFDDSRSRIVAVTESLERTLDSLIGAEPQAVGDDKNLPASSGQINRLEQTAEFLMNECTMLEAQVARLNRAGLG